MARPAITLELLSSDALYEREVLKLTDGETEDDLNHRLVQAALEVGLTGNEIAHCVGTSIVFIPTTTAPSSTYASAIHSPNSRGSVNTQSTAATSRLSIHSTDARSYLQRPNHRNNISISSLFGPLKSREMNQPPLESVPMTLPEACGGGRRAKPHSRNRGAGFGWKSSGLRKLSKGFSSRRKDSAIESGPWLETHSETTEFKFAMPHGIHTGFAGRVSVNDQKPMPPFIVDSRDPGRAPSIKTEAGVERRGFLSRSGDLWRRRGDRNNLASPINMPGKHSWSTTDLALPADAPLSPLSSMDDETEGDDASTSLQAMLASSPFDATEPLRREMKAAMMGRPYITVQAQNRGELRRLKAFRNKQLLALATLHEMERSKMLIAYAQEEELINAKFRQALNHLNEDGLLLAELELLAALDDRLKKEQVKLRHMKAYCSPSSGRTVTHQNLMLLENQKLLVEQLRSDKYRQDSSNHLREKQNNEGLRLPKQQQAELAEICAKKERALRTRELVEMEEVRALNGVIRTRRDASAARGNLRLEMWRRRLERDSHAYIPGPLPYLRTEEIFDAFWMVDVPLRSVLDDVLPWTENKRATIPRSEVIAEGKG